MMQSHDHEVGCCGPGGTQPHKPWYQTVWGWALLGLLAILAYYLWTEHRAHVIAILPFGILLMCPLMHMFGHGHGGHRHLAPEDDANKASPETAATLKPVYTCSMHPEVQQDQPGKCPKCGMTLQPKTIIDEGAHS